jgi:hypothetical protein
MLEKLPSESRKPGTKASKNRSGGGQYVTVNRTNAISWLGSAFCTNEENYLFQKMAGPWVSST